MFGFRSRELTAREFRQGHWPVILDQNRRIFMRFWPLIANRDSVLIKKCKNSLPPLAVEVVHISPTHYLLILPQSVLDLW